MTRKGTKISGLSEIAQLINALAAKHDDPSSIPEERIHSHKLSSNLHKHNMAHACYAQNKRINIILKKISG